MTRISTILAALILAGVPQACWACGPHYRCRTTYYVKPGVAVVAPAVAVSAVFVEVPLYSVGPAILAPGSIPVASLPVAVPPVAVPAPVDQPPASTPLPTTPAAKVETAKPETKVVAGDWKAVLVKRCADCHEAAVATDKGDGFVLLNAGVPVSLTDKQQRNMYRVLSSGKMPKLPARGQLSEADYAKLVEAKKLPQDEYDLLLSWLDGLK